MIMKIHARNLDEVYSIRAWLDENLGKGSEIKPWYAIINEQIVYRCNDGFSWIMSYGYQGNLIVNIDGLDDDTETMLRLRFGD